MPIEKSQKVRLFTKLLAVVASACAPANGAAIRAVGALGNSGEAGAGLVRVGQFDYDNAHSGAALDRDGTLWLSGGDRINRVGLDGRLIESFPLEPQGSRVDSRAFATLDGTLYFFGRFGGSKVALFALPMRSGKRAKPLPVELPPRKRDHVAWCLAPEPLDGCLVLAAEPKDAPEDLVTVYLLDPKTNALRTAFKLKGSYPHGVAVDPLRETTYVGAQFGLFVGGTTHQTVYGITAVRPDGTALSEGFPVACTKTPALPTQFRGILSLAGGALWESAWYGFLARLDLEGRGAPGRIVEWHHELHYPTQVLGLREGPGDLDPLLIATPMPDAFYFVVWDRAGRQLRFVRRIGCLPVIASVGLSEGGWVTAGTARTHLWWRWDDPGDAPPHKAELHIPVTPVFFQGAQCLGLAAQYRLDDLMRRAPVPTVFSSRVGDRNEARRVGEPVPMRQPVGLAVGVTPGQHRARALVSDAATKQVWQTGLWVPNLQPEAKWQPIRIEGEELTAPADLAAFTDGRLLVADGGRLLLLRPEGEAYRAEWAFDRWGNGPAERFGPRLRFALDGAWLLASDAERHRVVWLEWATRRVLGQFGETDEPGDDAGHVRGPTFVALRGTRAVVADAGNQRLLKLVLEP